jgi:hypothetical protein
MKPWQLNRRINGVSEKLRDTTSGSILRLDFDSFSDSEKLLFHKVDEIDEKYRQTGSEEVLVENSDLIFKNLEIILKRVTELYCYVVPMVLGSDGSHEIVEYFFKLHFYNFEADLSECLTHVRSWSEKDREEFLLDLKKNGSMYFRIPRGFNDHNDRSFSDMSNSKDLVKQVDTEDESEFGKTEVAD